MRFFSSAVGSSSASTGSPLFGFGQPFSFQMGSRTMPSARHFRGGFLPSSAHRAQTFLPLLNHLSWRSISSSDDGVHLLRRILRMASGDISKFLASTSVE